MRIQNYFSQITERIHLALTPEIRDSFPDYAARLDKVIDEAGSMLNEAFHYSHTEEQRLSYMECFTNRLGALRILTDSPAPGDAFIVDKNIMDAAYKTIEQSMLIRYEVCLPKGDDVWEIYPR